MLKPITSPEALAERVEELGFLPLFRCCVPGLSVEEMTPRELWFAPDTDGPWEWKGPVLRTGRCAERERGGRDGRHGDESERQARFERVPVGVRAP